MIKRKQKAKATMKPPMSEFSIMGLGLGIIGHLMATAIRAGRDIQKEADFSGDAGSEDEALFGQDIQAGKVEDERQREESDKAADEKIVDHILL